ncbi:MAG: hypothetical protein GZ087_03265 [Flavobacterium sp.]|nr:hypothetical protein [Flavobacterium sp.]
MLENIVIAVFALMLLSALFLIGLFVGIGSALDIVDADHQRENDLDCFEDLYCFECEMEMSVKEIDGKRHCGNCGLRH